MAWTVACFCGAVWAGYPPDACPACGARLDVVTPDRAAREFAERTAAEIDRLPTLERPR